MSSRVIAFVAQSDAPASTRAWISTDGITWQPDVSLSLAGTALGRFAARVGALVGLDGTLGRPQLWRWVSGGRWAQVGLPSPRAVLRDLTAVSDGFLAIGREGDPDVALGGVGVRGTGVPAAWFSADSNTWTATRVDGTAVPGAQLNRVLPTADGYLAVGNDDAASPRSAVLWSSSDARIWQRLGPPAHWGLATTNGRELVVFAYADAQTGLLGAWRTRDGATWTELAFAGDQTDIPAFIGSASVDSRVDGVYAMSDGLIVVGQRRGQITAWFASLK